MSKLAQLMRDRMLGVVAVGPRRLWLVNDAGDRLSVDCAGALSVQSGGFNLNFTATQAGTPAFVVDDDEVLFTVPEPPMLLLPGDLLSLNVGLLPL